MGYEEWVTVCGTGALIGEAMRSWVDGQEVTGFREPESPALRHDLESLSSGRVRRGGW